MRSDALGYCKFCYVHIRPLLCFRLEAIMDADRRFNIYIYNIYIYIRCACCLHISSITWGSTVPGNPDKDKNTSSLLLFTCITALAEEEEQQLLQQPVLDLFPVNTTIDHVFFRSVALWYDLMPTDAITTKRYDIVLIVTIVNHPKKISMLTATAVNHVKVVYDLIRSPRELHFSCPLFISTSYITLYARHICERGISHSLNARWRNSWYKWRFYFLVVRHIYGACITPGLLVHF